MLHVPIRRQPDDTSCLPSCVDAVLGFFGMDVEHAQVREWCHTTAVGSDVDLAIQGLNDAGVDAELRQCESLDELEELLSEGRPPIVALSEGGSWSHSVVVCGMDEATVTVMDPRFGSEIHIPRDDFLLAWSSLAGETLLVGGVH
jgi:ABC-type bacteriocin/lantibiotic exporter with double-glycine peptidase domain